MECLILCFFNKCNSGHFVSSAGIWTGRPPVQKSPTFPLTRPGSAGLFLNLNRKMLTKMKMSHDIIMATKHFYISHSTDLYMYDIVSCTKLRRVHVYANCRVSFKRIVGLILESSIKINAALRNLLDLLWSREMEYIERAS